MTQGQGKSSRTTEQHAGLLASQVSPSLLDGLAIHHVQVDVTLQLVTVQRHEVVLLHNSAGPGSAQGRTATTTTAASSDQDCRLTGARAVKACTAHL